ncbi:RNI-like protein, partial [Lichtheimia hyalospora FSU 10163]
RHQEESHLVFRLPEVVNLIIQYLVKDYDTSSPSKSLFDWIYPCLLVNHLWHDCAARNMYRTLTFGQGQHDLNAFQNLVLSLSQETTAPLHMSPASLAIGNKNSFPTIDPFHVDNSLSNSINDMEVDDPRLSVYRRSVRHLTLYKVKDDSVTDKLTCLSKHVRRLEHLELYICEPIIDSAVLPFVMAGHLTYLSLAGSFQVSDKLIHAVAKHCPRLQHLDLRACSEISDDSISAIALHCPRLEHLNVGRIKERHRITSRSINLIAENTQVRVLGFAGCDLDDECMIRLAVHRNRFMERISVNNCHRLSNASIRAFAKYCTKLSVFEMKECHLIDDWDTVAQLVERK